MNKDIQQLATQLYSPLFAECDTINEAYENAISIAYYTDNCAGMTAAIHVLMNSIAAEIEKRNTTRRVVVTGKSHVDPEADEEERSRPICL